MKKKHAMLTAAVSALGMASGGVAHAQQAPVTVPPPPPPTVTTAWNGGSETREEDRRFHVSGRVQFDVADTNADYCAAAPDLTSSAAAAHATRAACLDGVRSYARRVFIGVDGRLTQNWRYNVKLDLNLAQIPAGVTDPSKISSSVRLDDAYLEYAGQDYSFIIGNNNAVSPMEDRDSSLNIPFNERSFLISASGVGKRPGIAFITNGGNWSLGANLSGNDSLDTADSASNGTESWFVGGRATWAPFFEQTPDGTEVLHLGLYARHRDNGSGNANLLPTLTNSGNGLFSYSPNALSAKSNNNAGVGGADSDNFYDGEFAFQWNQFGAEGEYGQIDTHDFGGPTLNPVQRADASITGYYFDVFWSPTGESRRYNAADGSFGAITPRRTFGSDGGIGHLMLSARYEDYDATDRGFWKSATNGGNAAETTAYTLGATWVPISHVKFQLNYSHTKVDYVDNHTDQSTTLANAQPNRDNQIDAVTLRTQFDW